MIPNDIIYFQEVDIDKSTMPDIIYKYRNWDNPKHRRIITDKEIYFASPLEMEEMHELYFEIDFGRIDNKDQFYNFFYQTAHQFGYYSHTERDSIAKYMVCNSPILKDANRRNHKEWFRQKLNVHATVFCASEHRDNLNLWQQFGGNGKGFCVGLNLKEITKEPKISSTISKVQYLDKPSFVPAITYDEKEVILKYLTCLFSLNNMFSAENEIRLVKLFMEKKANILPEKCFIELVLGYDISEKNKKEILKNVKNNFKSIQIFQCTLAESQFNFQLIQ